MCSISWPHLGQFASVIASLALPTFTSPLSRNSDIHLSLSRSASPESNQMPWHPVHRSTTMRSIEASCIGALHFGQSILIPCFTDVERFKQKPKLKLDNKRDEQSRQDEKANSARKELMNWRDQKRFQVTARRRMICYP